MLPKLYGKLVESRNNEARTLGELSCLKGVFGTIRRSLLTLGNMFDDILEGEAGFMALLLLSFFPIYFTFPVLATGNIGSSLTTN